MVKFSELALLEGVHAIGDCERQIEMVQQLSANSHHPGSLTWCSDKNSERIKELDTTNIIVSEQVSPSLFKADCNYLICKNPRLLFLKVVGRYFVEEEPFLIAPSAKIDPTVRMGTQISIGEHVVIEKNCSLGNNVRIDHNTVIKANTIIGSHVTIGANTTIGGCGLGYEKDEDGNYQLIPHIGNVVIHDYVEIGQSNCIDRAVIGSTILFDYVKTDNLVHIAHGVSIGKNSMLTANVTIAGSTHLGENVWLAPTVTVMNNIRLEDNVFVGLGAVVLKSVQAGSLMVGNPAKNLKKIG